MAINEEVREALADDPKVVAPDISATGTALSVAQTALLDAVGAITRLNPEATRNLTDDAKDDWQALQACAVRIEPLLSDPLDDEHELRNLAGALRGYTEMLLEGSTDASEPFRQALEDVLQGTAETGRESSTQAGDFATALSTTPRANLQAGPRVQAGEPGFILAVDDRAENRELLARYLTRSGHFVVTASSGEEALDMLNNADVDVVLLDRMMPGMDGREVLRRIKAEPHWRATPVIMISGEQDMEGIIECIEAGADDYLFKPFNPVLLQARINAGIERKRWHDREQLYRDQLERNERFIRATFGRYLSDDIVTEILERPEGLELGGDLREVTIMMSDIRGFTTLSEQLAPDRVVSMLNRYLAAMTDIIMEYGGTIDEFLGDAILAVFGAPKRHPDDPDRAANCALAMQAIMQEINAANRADGLPELEMGIALNTGTVIAGNIGSERRSKYGFVGHAMNVTSRIEDVAARGEILIAESTRIALRNAYQLGESRSIAPPGMDEEITVHPLQKALS